ncbi:MAG: hypothetical protein R3297_05055 [Desulfobulbales bacterium]|nr:hypothetical protein [Desulfobulbales bacterium]
MNKKIQALLFIVSTLLLVPLSGTAAGKSIMVGGIILAASGPLADSAVYAYPDFPSLARGINGIKSSPGEKEGQFLLEVEPGTYYLVAEGVRNGKKYFAYHGLNPVALNEDNLWLPFFVVEAIEPLVKEGPEGIGGIVRYKGQPLSGGVISAYPPTDKSFRGMGLLANTITGTGRFWFDLEPGQYVLVARKRLGDNTMGPLRKGDLFCYPAANPLQVLPSRSTEIEISCYPRDDMEAFLESAESDPRGRRETARRTASLHETQIEDASRKQQEMMLQQPVRVSGTVRDISGKPTGGLYVSAYSAEQFPLFQMFVIRLITDHITKTDANGRYSLDLENGREYYLVAREKIGEAPDRLELYGLYEGSANHSFTVGPDLQDREIDITVERIMP